MPALIHSRSAMLSPFSCRGAALFTLSFEGLRPSLAQSEFGGL